MGFDHKIYDINKKIVLYSTYMYSGHKKKNRERGREANLNNVIKQNNFILRTILDNTVKNNENKWKNIIYVFLVFS